MSQELWSQVDGYLAAQYLEQDDLLEQVIREQEARGLPAIQVSPLEGRLLQLLVGAMRAKNVLEIGTLGGYSAILLARALPDDGRVITLELNTKHAEAAQAAFRATGVAHKIDLRPGLALETLPKLRAENHVFDFVFIDADKENNVYYVQQALALSRPGTLIVVDNVIRDGDVMNEASESPMTQGVRRMNDFIKSEPRLMASALQTVGSKGYDGMAFMLVVE
ncbi:MAG: O-methyltransferase [bacterium]|nr:O-methyltransferase [bacterium]